MKPLWIVGLGALLVPAFSAMAADASTVRHRAVFSYTMGSLADGAITGHCEAQAVLFGPGAGEFLFESAGGVLEHYTTEFNYTAIDPRNEGGIRYYGPLEPTQIQSNISVPAGVITVKWGDDGRARVFGEGWPYMSHQVTEASGLAFNATYDVRSIRAESPASVSGGAFFIKWKGHVSPNLGKVVGTNIVLAAAHGTMNLTGGLATFLASGRVEGPGGFSYQAPPYWENVSAHETELAGIYRVRAHHVVVRSDEARIPLDASQANLVCQRLSGRVDGSLVAYDARGRVDAGNESVDFARQELLIRGRLDYAQSVIPSEADNAATVAFDGQGEFTTVGIDFKNTGIVSDSVPNWVEVGLWTLIVTAVGGALAYVSRALAPFYTRLEKPALLDQATRTHVVEALRNTPWMTMAEVQRSTGLGRSTIRYQLTVLVRHGMVKSTSRGWGARFAVRLDGLTPSIPPLDPIGQTVQREASTSPIRLSALMRLIQREHGVSRTGAWNAVQRLVGESKISIERREGAVWARYRS